VGEALRTIGAEIALAEQNGDSYRAQTLHLYRAWVHFHALDFEGVLKICEPLLPSVQDIARGPWRRLCHILIGSAKTGLGKYASALKDFERARYEMDRQKVIHDWYWRMILESGATDLALVQGDLVRARSLAESFLRATLSTAERTWQALAWEASARVAAAGYDTEQAYACVAKALSTMEGFEVPLAAWRVHATAAGHHQRWGTLCRRSVIAS
jgi:tetratricopeptide (TPR) repeat protein